MVDCLLECLQEAHLEKYHSNFTQHGLTQCEALTRLQMHDYARFGIVSMADRVRLFKLIQIIKSVQSEGLYCKHERTEKPAVKSSEAVAGNKSNNQNHPVTARAPAHPNHAAPRKVHPGTSVNEQQAEQNHHRSQNDFKKPSTPERAPEKVSFRPVTDSPIFNCRKALMFDESELDESKDELDAVETDVNANDEAVNRNVEYTTMDGGRVVMQSREQFLRQAGYPVHPPNTTSQDKSHFTVPPVSAHTVYATRAEDHRQHMQQEEQDFLQDRPASTLSTRTKMPETVTKPENAQSSGNTARNIQPSGWSNIFGDFQKNVKDSSAWEVKSSSAGQSQCEVSGEGSLVPSHQSGDQSVGVSVMQNKPLISHHHAAGSEGSPAHRVEVPTPKKCQSENRPKMAASSQSDTDLDSDGEMAVLMDKLKHLQDLQARRTALEESKSQSGHSGLAASRSESQLNCAAMEFADPLSACASRSSVCSDRGQSFSPVSASGRSSGHASHVSRNHSDDSGAHTQASIRTQSAVDSSQSTPHADQITSGTSEAQLTEHQASIHSSLPPTSWQPPLPISFDGTSSSRTSSAHLVSGSSSQNKINELTNQHGSAEIREFRVLATSSTTEVVEDAAKTRNSRISVSGVQPSFLPAPVMNAPAGGLSAQMIHLLNAFPHMASQTFPPRTVMNSQANPSSTSGMRDSLSSRTLPGSVVSQGNESHRVQAVSTKSNHHGPSTEAFSHPAAFFIETQSQHGIISPKVSPIKPLSGTLSRDDMPSSAYFPSNLLKASQQKEVHVERIVHGAGYDYGVPSSPQGAPVHERSGIQRSDQKIRVCVRKRPLTKRELKRQDPDIVKKESDNTVVVAESRVAIDLSKFIQQHEFSFDEVFDSDCTNRNLYTSTAKPLVKHTLSGGCATCFAFGQTGAGKTYTLMGTVDTPGLYVLAGSDLCAAVMANKHKTGLRLWLSYYEIYCGQLYDLLNKRKKLFVRENGKHRVCIAGLMETQITNPKEMIQAVEYGNACRRIGTTGVNPNSSRSHAILQMELRDSHEKRLGRLTFIDLAGSERAADATDYDRRTRIEGAEINQSLLALKECIRSLDQDSKHTPFRQSKLTHILRESFTGNARTCMIANISPTLSACENTLNTLRYASRVKELRRVKTTPVTSAPSRIPANVVPDEAANMDVTSLKSGRNLLPSLFHPSAIQCSSTPKNGRTKSLQDPQCSFSQILADESPVRGHKFRRDKTAAESRSTESQMNMENAEENRPLTTVSTGIPVTEDAPSKFVHPQHPKSEGRNFAKNLIQIDQLSPRETNGVLSQIQNKEAWTVQSNRSPLRGTQSTELPGGRADVGRNSNSGSRNSSLNSSGSRSHNVVRNLSLEKDNILSEHKQLLSHLDSIIDKARAVINKPSPHASSHAQSPAQADSGNNLSSHSSHEQEKSQSSSKIDEKKVSIGSASECTSLNFGSSQTGSEMFNLWKATLSQSSHGSGSVNGVSSVGEHNMSRSRTSLFPSTLSDVSAASNPHQVVRGCERIMDSGNTVSRVDQKQAVRDVAASSSQPDPHIGGDIYAFTTGSPCTTISILPPHYSSPVQVQSSLVQSLPASLFHQITDSHRHGDGGEAYLRRLTSDGDLLTSSESKKLDSGANQYLPRALFLDSNDQLQMTETINGVKPKKSDELGEPGAGTSENHELHNDCDDKLAKNMGSYEKEVTSSQDQFSVCEHFQKSDHKTPNSSHSDSVVSKNSSISVSNQSRSHSSSRVSSTSILKSLAEQKLGSQYQHPDRQDDCVKDWPLSAATSDDRAASLRLRQFDDLLISPSNTRRMSPFQPYSPKRKAGVQGSAVDDNAALKHSAMTESYQNGRESTTEISSDSGVVVLTRGPTAESWKLSSGDDNDEGHGSTLEDVSSLGAGDASLRRSWDQGGRSSEPALSGRKASEAVLIRQSSDILPSTIKPSIIKKEIIARDGTVYLSGRDSDDSDGCQSTSASNINRKSTNASLEQQVASASSPKSNAHIKTEKLPPVTFMPIHPCPITSFDSQPICTPSVITKSFVGDINRPMAASQQSAEASMSASQTSNSGSRAELELLKIQSVIEEIKPQLDQSSSLPYNLVDPPDHLDLPDYTGDGKITAAVGQLDQSEMRSPSTRSAGTPRSNSSASSTCSSIERRTARQKAQSLLVLAHEDQLAEITSICKAEMKLLMQLKLAHMSFDEYVEGLKEILTSKSQCVDTLRSQIHEFANYPSRVSRSEKSDQR